MLNKKLHRIMPIILCAALTLNAVPLNASAAEIYNKNDTNVINGGFPDAAAQEETAAETETNAFIEDEVKAETLPETETMPETNAFIETETEAETEVPPETETMPETNTFIEAESEAEVPPETQSASEEQETPESREESEAGKLKLQALIDSFNALAAKKPLMALLYRTESYEVRSEPSNDSVGIITINSGHTLYIKSVEITGDAVWYQVQLAVLGNEYTGYVEAYYLAHSDEDWIKWESEYLNAFLAENGTGGILPYALNSNAYPDFSDIQAFPLHYQDKLKALKELHPNWIFVPMNTGLDFNTVVANEMGDRSLIQNTKSNADKGWVGRLYGSGWYFAEKDAVSHYVNPVNFLTESYIFQFEQLTFNGSYHTVSAIQNFLNGTFMKGNLPDDSSKSYAQAFYEIGKNRSLSPIHLASRVYQEQGNGTSPLISGTYKGYEGYYNYFNVSASGKTDEEVFRTGLSHAKSKDWNTHYKSLAGGAAVIGNNYILKGQDTLYLQKFDIDDTYNPLYVHQYMQNIQAPASEALTTRKMYANTGSLDSAFVFKIPVYKGMPGEIIKPQEHRLESITIDQASLILRTPGKLTGTDADTDTDTDTDTDASLALSYNPLNTTDEISVEWSLSNTGVVNMSVSGDSKKVTVSALKEGEVTVTAIATASSKYTDEVISKTALCRIRVIAPPAPVEKCTVTFMNRDNKTVLKQTDVPYEKTIDAQDFPAISGTGEELFIGWFTGKDGTGILIDETTIFSEKENTLYPYFEKQGKGFYVLPISDQTYTGSAIKPEAEVFDSIPDENGKNILIKLEKNKDYTVSYKNNKNASTADNASPAVVITGKGNYSGTQYAYFNIIQKKLTENDKDISAENITAAYNGKPQKPVPAVYHSGRKLVLNRDFTVSYTDISVNKPVDACTEKGTYIVTVEGMNNYSGTRTVYLKITNDILMSRVSVAKIPNQKYDKDLVNNGSGMKPETLTVTYKNDKLKEGEDYTVRYENNLSVGTATAYITAKGTSGFSGTKKVTYKIVGNPINKALAEGIASKAYTGNEKDVLQEDARLSLLDGTPLTENIDYTVSYQNTSKAGTASVIFKGINGCTGQLKKTYKITPLEINDTSVTFAYSTQDAPDKMIGIKSLSEIASPYMKGATCPNVQLYLNGTPLAKGKDYTIKYANNKQVTTSGLDEKKLPAITITGKGSFKGTLIGTWKITGSAFGGESDKVKLVLKDVVYKNAPNKHKTAVILADANGAKLSAGKDYDTNVTFSYAEGADKGKEINPSDILDAGTKIQVKVTGKGAYDGEITGTYRIVRDDISKAKVSVKTKTYQNGSPVTLTPEDINVTIKTINGEEKLEYGEEYTIDDDTYTGNLTKGRASVVIKGIGKNYGGEKKITFTIASKAILWNKSK